MSVYKYLRKIETFKPLDYSYSAYGGDDFLDGFARVRAGAIASVEAYLQSHVRSGAQEGDLCKRAEFMAFDSIFNDSFYLPKMVGVAELNGLISTTEGLVADRLLKIYLLYLRRSFGVFDKQEAEPLLEISLCSEGVFVTGEALKLILLEGADTSLVRVIERDEVVKELTRKFEIFQRVFVSYDASYRKRSMDFQNITDYALLSIAAATVFQRSANYRYLNALVKINDLLSGENLLPSNINEALFMKIAIDKEAAIVKGLREKS